MTETSGLGYEVLEAIAARFHVRVRSAAMLMRGTELDRICKFQIHGRTVECATDGSILYVELRARSPIVFALGGTDPLRVLADQPIDEIEGVTIYAKTGWRSAVTDWLSHTANRTLVKNLALRAGEVVVVAIDGLQGTLTADRPETSWLRIEGIASIADSLGRQTAVVGDTSELFDEANPRLPIEFAHLAPFAKKWAVLDDHIRGDMTSVASTASLRELVRAVTPHLSRIDELLDHAHEPLPDELIWLGALAHAAVEARLELERRKKLND